MLASCALCVHPLTLQMFSPQPWSIPEEEMQKRLDMREERIFTIDPRTAKDLDDALSIKKQDDGTYVVGVHIADVCAVFSSLLVVPS